MIGKLISSFFNFLLTIVMTIIQLICAPLNALFNNVFPNFSEKISMISEALNIAYTNISWAIGILPPMVRETLLFIFTVELSILLIMRSSHMTAKVWSILQKLKFW